MTLKRLESAMLTVMRDMDEVERVVATLEFDKVDRVDLARACAATAACHAAHAALDIALQVLETTAEASDGYDVN